MEDHLVGIPAYLRTINPIEYGKKYNITATYSNNISNILLNNKNENQSEIELIPYSEMNEITIGNWNTNKEYFNGNIYSIRMYNRKLTDEEIKQNYEIDKIRYNIDE